MKIYTQTGDRGKTSLLSGERVTKDHARIRAYGEIDELNSVLGALIASLDFGDEAVQASLLGVQSDLMHVGAWLAATPGSASRKRLSLITGAHCRAVEAAIDTLDEQLPELKAFILPGGHMRAAWSHVVRTVCRRAERAAVHLSAHPDQQGPERDDLSTVIAYLNRLSDYFFVLARYLNQQAGVADRIWRP